VSGEFVVGRTSMVPVGHLGQEIVGRPSQGNCRAPGSGAAKASDSTPGCLCERMSADKRHYDALSASANLSRNVSHIGAFLASLAAKLFT
jgi:hypothetical protein